VRERQHYSFVGEALVGDELADVIMTYRVDAISELMPWLLQWGADVDVLGPPDLREQMLREAQRLFGLLSKQLPAIEQKLIADSQD
jgi:predicted DNA-binding transcriptional regulator YafY